LETPAKLPKNPAPKLLVDFEARVSEVWLTADPDNFFRMGTPPVRPLQ